MEQWKTMEVLPGWEVHPPLQTQCKQCSFENFSPFLILLFSPVHNAGSHGKKEECLATPAEPTPTKGCFSGRGKHYHINLYIAHISRIQFFIRNVKSILFSYKVSNSILKNYFLQLLSLQKKLKNQQEQMIRNFNQQTSWSCQRDDWGWKCIRSCFYWNGLIKHLMDKLDKHR